MSYVLGIDLGGQSCKGAIVSDAGEIIARREHPTDNVNGEKILQSIMKVINDLAADAKDKGIEVAAVGIGSPGPLDPHQGVIVATPNLKFERNYPLREKLVGLTGLSVVLENDANVAAYGEAWIGGGRGKKVVVALTLGTGIGGGVIIGDKIFNGAYGLGAELGHIMVEPDGRACNAGHQGCFEAHANAKAIIDWGQELVGPEIENPKQVQERAEAGHAGAILVWNRVGIYLGRALGALIDIFNPDVIVISGKIAKAWKLFEPKMMEEIALRAFSDLAAQAEIRPAVLGEDAGIIGAARLALNAQL
ncbi:MAG: ROK family protein [Candidatus Magasanikbacteria bacterium]|nr:ROK family protein [Candidatus Magasanikbacteria bacterium]